MSRIAVVLYAVGLVMLVHLVASLWHQEQTRRTFRATYQPLYEAAIKSLELDQERWLEIEAARWERNRVLLANRMGFIPGETDTLRIDDLGPEDQRWVRRLISWGIEVDAEMVQRGPRLSWDDVRNFVKTGE